MATNIAQRVLNRHLCAAAPMQYRSLEDAAMYDPKYGAPGAMVWYAEDDALRDLLMGSDFCLKHEIPLPTRATLKRTHKLLGTVGTHNPDEIFNMMQGEAWSPNGEARAFISHLGIHHTSMSVGDVIEIGSKLLMVDGNDFYECE